jgi:hypothetical protein
MELTVSGLVTKIKDNNIYPKDKTTYRNRPNFPRESSVIPR